MVEKTTLGRISEVNRGFRACEESPILLGRPFSAAKVLGCSRLTGCQRRGAGATVDRRASTMLVLKGLRVKDRLERMLAPTRSLSEFTHRPCGNHHDRNEKYYGRPHGRPPQ